MPLTLLAITSIVILTLAVSASESRAADTKASSSPPNMVAGAVKAPPARNAGKQVAAPAKAPDGDSKAVRRASGPQGDDALLGFLWVLMGSSRRR
jgi:hypothetical protein